VVRAAVFDLDGTLVDSLADIAAALLGALSDFSARQPTLAEVQTWIGHGARSLVARAVPDAALIDPVLLRFRERYRAEPVVATRVYDGIPAVLDHLAAAGWRLAVLSNKPHDLTDAIVARLLPGRFAAVAGHQPGGPLKPAPAAGADLLRALDVPASQCAMIGDSAVDIAFARATGMRAIGVTWGLQPRAELVAAAPDLLVDAPSALFGLTEP
jgi:phosphoglycolate phosphatase